MSPASRQERLATLEFSLKAQSLAAYHFELAHVEAQIEAQIEAMAPELPLPSRHRTYQPNPYARGELPRVALAILRESGEPLPIRVIAARALALKDCRAPTRRIFKMTRCGYSISSDGWTHGLEETEKSIGAKHARGTFSATFLLACLAVLEIEGIQLATLWPAGWRDIGPVFWPLC